LQVHRLRLVPLASKKALLAFLQQPDVEEMPDDQLFIKAPEADAYSFQSQGVIDMLEKLESDAASDASHKAYCDKETSEATAKKDEKKALIDKLSTKIGSMSAKSAKLKEEVAALQKQLAELASSQAEMNKIRSDEKALYTKNKAEMEAGIEGVKKALEVLKQYYAQEGAAHTAAEGAGGGIISMLEVIESDFARLEAETTAAEATAQKEYDEFMTDSKVDKAAKVKDIEHKTAKKQDQNQALTVKREDLDGTQKELDAALACDQAKTYAGLPTSAPRRTVFSYKAASNSNENDGDSVRREGADTTHHHQTARQ